MAVTLSAKVGAYVKTTYVDSDDLNPKRGNLNVTEEVEFTSGTGTLQADLQFYDTRTLTGASESLDLAGGLADVFGNTLTFADVKSLYIKNTSTAKGEDLLVGGAAANALATPFGDSSDKIRIRAEGHISLAAPRDGYAVTGGTGDLLKIDPGADTITYDIIILGDSVAGGSGSGSGSGSS